MLRKIQPYHVYIEGALNLSVRGTTLDVRVWRWSSIETSLYQFLVFSGCDKKTNGVLRHLCAHIGLTGPGEPSEDGWDEWGDTVLQTHDSKFGPWRSEAEHATSQSRRLPTILNLYEWAGKKRFVSLKLENQSVFQNTPTRARLCTRRVDATTDTGFEIRALAVWGRARYLSVTEVPHNIECLRVSG